MSVYQKNWSQIFRFKGQDIDIEDTAQINFHVDLDAVTFGKSDSVERRLSEIWEKNRKLI